MTIVKGRPLHWAITATAGTGFMLFGYDQGVMSGLLTGTAFTAQFPEIDTNPGAHGSSSLQGTVVAIYEIGCFFGSLHALVLCEKLGRRWSIMLGCIILSIGGALQASALTIPHLIVGRIVAGLGNGLNTSTIPVWHSELMQAEVRGKGLCIELAINIFGVMTAYWVDYGMSFINNESQFRFPLALQCLFAIATFLGILVLPESPRWLIANERHDEARPILRALLPNADDELVNAEMNDIQHAVNEEREAASGSSFKALLKNGQQKFFYGTMLGIGGQFMQQLSGINLITYYAPVIFEQSVGMPHSLSLLLAGFNGVAYWVSSLIAIRIIDRLGRRKLMLFAAAGQGVCMAILAATVSNVPAEYAPLAIRGRAAALASASNWIFTFLVVEITPVSIKNIEWRTYIYFCILNFLFLPLIYFFYPETQNLSLEQVDKLFTGGKIMLHWTSSMGEVGDIAHRAPLTKTSSSHEVGNAKEVESITI